MGSLTPLTFTWHRSSPLAFLLPVCTFFTMEGGDSEYEKFTVPNLKAFLKSQSECVKQELVAYAIGCQNTHFSHAIMISSSAEKRCKDTFPHPPSPFLSAIFAYATEVAFVPLHNSRFNFQCYAQREQKPLRNWPRSGSCNLSRLLAQKITKGIHSLTHTSFSELLNTFYKIISVLPSALKFSNPGTSSNSLSSTSSVC